MLIKRIQCPDLTYPHEVWFEPELVVRESTASLQNTSQPSSRRAKG
jgi:hypothetical protein